MTDARLVRARAQRRIGRLCSSSLDERAFRAEILADLHPAIGFDAYAWLLTDPATEVGYAPLADVPCLPELPRLIRAKYLTAVNRWTSLTGVQPVGLLQQATGGGLTGSKLWRDVLSRYGVHDVASTAFRDRHGCWGFLDLWRMGTSGTFGPDDAALLRSIAGPVATALRLRQAQTFLAPSGPARRRDGPAILVLDGELAITATTAPATGWLDGLLPAEPGGSAIPAAAYNVAAQLLAVEAGIDAHPAAAAAFVPGRTWVSLRASRMSSTQDPADSQIAVSIEEAPAGLRLALFVRTHGLTAREEDVLRLVARGLDTHGLAQELSISEYTVQDHLQSVFARTSLKTRTALLTAALGADPA